MHPTEQMEATVTLISSSPYRASRLAVATVAALVVLCPAASARVRDHTPPVFGGLASATTCIPGPIGPGIQRSYHLSWEAANDNKTRSRAIVYEIYQSTGPGLENFSQPTYTSKRGRLFFDTPALASTEAFYFVVRARDRAGNEDTNTIEREGVNLCV